MKNILTFILACCIVQFSQAQNAGSPKFSPGDYFNNFQKFTNESPDVNAAFVNVQKLASNPAYEILVTELIHNSFAQEFINRPDDDEEQLERRAKRKPLVIPILEKMASDTLAALRAQTQPLYLTVKVQEAAKNPKELTMLTNQFITSEIDGKDIYRYRAGRYGLIILHIISKRPELKQLSGELLVKLASKFEAGQVPVTDSSTHAELGKRAWFRYMNACAYFEKSELAINREQKENMLKAAFEFSPDLVDKNNQNAYFYDMHMLWGGSRQGFENDYLNFVTTNTDKQQVMATLLKMALVEPSYKENLRNLHREIMPDENFNTYWNKGIEAQAAISPPIALPVLGQKTFSSKSQSGQWILVDFWGTWCAPCRKEHPALQKFYDSTLVDQTKNLSLLTVACRDTQAKVTAYMNKMKYNFPVAMSDNKIEKAFKVQGYPTKILITPKGKYVTVPFGVDWVSFVNKYVEVD